jgi:micrococcal nuclease
MKDIFMKRLAALTVTLGLLFPVTSKAGEYDFKVLRVVDGDTIAIEVPGLPKEINKLSLRILHVDTPEKGHLAKCDLERQKSKQATDFVFGLVSSGKEIKVEIKKWDKYGGRVLGDLIIDGKRLSAQLIDAGLAIEYNGEKKTKDWCQ